MVLLLIGALLAAEPSAGEAVVTPHQTTRAPAGTCLQPEGLGKLAMTFQRARLGELASALSDVTGRAWSYPADDGIRLSLEMPEPLDAAELLVGVQHLLEPAGLHVEQDGERCRLVRLGARSATHVKAVHTPVGWSVTSR
jgi:hypothetical protein